MAMLSALHNHPFDVESFFETSLVLTYALPKEELESRIPPCLELDTFQDKWAFLAVALVQTRHLRPRGFPQMMGNDFFLTGYRIFVRYTTSAGKRLRGLYILKSETDRKMMTFLGNLFTQYHYTTSDFDTWSEGPLMRIRSSKSELDIAVVSGKEEARLPAQSPFHDWKEARRFAGPLPFTFTYNEKKKEVLIIEGMRENWLPAPVEVIRDHVGFLRQTDLEHAVLANAFLVRNIPYHWKKGRIDTWKG